MTVSNSDLPSELCADFGDSHGPPRRVWLRTQPSPMKGVGRVSTSFYRTGYLALLCYWSLIRRGERDDQPAMGRVTYRVTTPR